VIELLRAAAPPPSFYAGFGKPNGILTGMALDDDLTGAMVSTPAKLAPPKDREAN
jgi:hypothetical protein